MSALSGRNSGNDARALAALASAGYTLTDVDRLLDHELLRIPDVGGAALRRLRRMAARADGRDVEADALTNAAAGQAFRERQRAAGLVRVEAWVPVALVEQARRVVNELVERQQK